MLYNKKGLTLVEILVSITIIGMLALTFMAMFGVGIKNILIAGDNSKSDFLTQSLIERQVSGAFSQSNISRTNKTIYLKKNNVLSSTVTGTAIFIDYPYNNTTKTAITFIAE